MITTYGVFGKVEYVLSLIIGCSAVTVDFDGGSISSRGVIPASYTTNNPLIQRALESTPEYKHGIIRKIRSLPEACDVEASRKIAQAKAEAALKKAPGGEADTAQEGDKQPEGSGEAQGTGLDGEGEGPADGSEAGVEALSPEESGAVEVSVTCMEDAVEYLKNHFEGYTSSKLRSNPAIERAAADHGIVFKGL